MLAGIDVADLADGLEQPWSPLTVATMNDYDVRVVKTFGEFTRHTHIRRLTNYSSFCVARSPSGWTTAP